VSAADVTDGNSEEVAHGGSEEEAVWLDLVGRFAAPAVPADAPAPWPDSENLATPWPDSENLTAPAGTSEIAPAGTGEVGTGEIRSAGTSEIAPAGTGEIAPAGTGEIAPAGTGEVGTGEIRSAGTGEIAPAGTGEIWPARAGEAQAAAGRAADLPEDDEEHYVPPPPPPLPRLSSVTKGAWVALFGGPGYLLAATMAGWTISPWLGFGAVAAFIGGFIVLVLHVGNDHDRDSGPDDGAVV
jgi:hypothetical protein